jgi:TRAP-type C4-dicarboxylate transport system substrate-binding protein
MASAINSRSRCKMLNVRSRWLGPPLALLAITLAGCQVPAADKAGGPPSPVTMTLATGEGDPSEVASFVDAVRRLSGGSLTIEVKTAWRKGEATYETGLVKDVIAGKADIGVVGVRAFDEEGLDVTSFQGFVAPFLIDSYELQDRVLDSDVAKETLRGIEPLGLTGLGFDPGPLRRPLGITRQLAGAADFEGATFGAREGHVVALTLEALGGTSRVFVPDQAAGLDGMEAHLALIGNAGYDRNAVALTSDVVLWPRVSVLVANTAAFGKLTAEQQAIVRHAAALSREERPNQIRSEEAEGLLILCRRGLRTVTINDAEAEGLLRTVAPVYQEIERDPLSKELIDEVRRLRSDVAAGANASVSCGEGASPDPGSAAATELDGAWTACTTREELLAAGADASEDQPDNFGCFVLEFERGRFRTYRPESSTEVGRPVNADGTYDLEADNRITFNLDNGEKFEFVWSVFQDTLSFRKTGIGGPTGFIVKPFTRVGR